MPETNRVTLRQYFHHGATPTQEQFADLVDSQLNLVDDGVTVDAAKRIGIGAANPSGRLTVCGAFDRSISGTIAVAAKTGAGETSTATGTGTRFTSELAPGDSLRIGALVLTVVSIASDTLMTVKPAPAVATPASPAFISGDLLSVQDVGGASKLVLDRYGNLGVGTANPAAKLEIDGRLMATALQGDGAAIINLDAAHLASGTIDAERIPPLEASKITGVLAVDQLPPIPASKLTGSEPFDLSLIPPIPAARVVGPVTPDQLAPIPASKLTGSQPFDLSLIPPIPAARVVGPVTPDQLAPIPASKLTGSEPFDISLIPPIPAARIVGPVTPDQLAPIPASKLTGSEPFDLSLIPPIPAARIVGPVTPDQLAPIPASKLTGSQPFDISLIPPIPAAKVFGLAEIIDDLRAQIADLRAKLGEPFNLFWSFDNVTTLGRISTSVGSSPTASVTAQASQTGGGPAENFSIGVVLLTRQFGTFFPFLEITSRTPIKLNSVAFVHYHNNNRGYPTYPSYQVRLQIDAGGGYKNLGDAVLTAGPATNGTSFTVPLAVNLPPGTFRIRWKPENLSRSATDTSSEYFALKNVAVNLQLLPAPAVV